MNKIRSITRSIGRVFKTVCLAAALVLPFLGSPPAAQAQQGNARVLPAFTNNVIVITNGATTFAGTTNRAINVPARYGLGFSFSALATNAGQATFYFLLSGDGTNYNDSGGMIVWGNTLNASGWITRSTNFPDSVIGNHSKIKSVIVSNSAARVVLSNCVFHASGL